MNATVRSAALEAVQSGSGPGVRGEECVELLQRTTAHQRESATKRFSQALQQPSERGIGDDGVRSGSDVEKRAVDVEEQAPVS